jgi:uncharacterized repeat protein (TIGR02543 family)
MNARRSARTLALVLLAITALASCSNLLQEALKADTAFVAQDHAALLIGYAGSDTEAAISQSITLPTTNAAGTTITWTSDNSAVISTSGSVTRPAFDAAAVDGGAVLVTLTASLQSGGATSTKTFKVTVLAVPPTDDQAVAADKAALLVGYVTGDGVSSITQNLSLPITGRWGSSIIWTSDNLPVIAANGVVTRPSLASGDATVELTAAIAKNAANAPKTFSSLIVKCFSGITFNANGGTGGSMSPQTIATGASATLAANAFTRAGYDFAGWATSAGGTVAYANGASYTMGTASVTLYAKWTASINSITFDANGGSGSMTAQTIATDASANLTANAFTRAGYTFAGWATTAGGSVAYANGASYTMGAADLTLYATWTANTNSVTFDANGGSGSMSPQSVATDASANLTANAFTRTGYTFDGWATTAGGSVAYADQASYTMGSTNATLYAKWTANINSITFDANGGAGSMSPQSIATDAAANLTANTFSRATFVFAGWATTSTGGVAYNDRQSYTMGSSNVTLFAVWTASASLLVNYNFDGQNCNDSSGNGKNGTASAVTYVSDGNGGYSASFNGSSSYIALPYDSVRSQPAFTIMMRFKASAGQYGSLFGYQNTVVGIIDGSTTQFIPMITILSNGKLYGSLWNGSVSIEVISSNVVNDGNWHTAYFSVKPDSIRLYLDGSPIGTGTGTVQHLSMSFNQIGTSLPAGRAYMPLVDGPSNSGWYYFNGLIDDFYLYSTALH